MKTFGHRSRPGGSPPGLDGPLLVRGYAVNVKVKYDPHLLPLNGVPSVP